MKTNQPRKVIIQIDSPVQQNVPNTRRGLKTLQPAAADKENLAGRPFALKDAKILSSSSETKKPATSLMHKETQTEKYITNLDDLTGDEASEDYWQRLAEKRQETLDETFYEVEKLKGEVETLQAENKKLEEQSEENYWKKVAEKRQEALDKSFHEIEKLKGHVEVLQEENKICKEMLEESKNLVEVLQEMINGEDDENEDNTVEEESPSSERE